MSKLQDNCSHRWVLNIAPASCECMCTKCFLRFKPQQQQITYTGILPDKYKGKW